MIRRGLLLAVFGLLALRPAAAQDAAPRRVVTLAPHLAELVYAAGAGDRLAGVTAYTDYPPAAADLPRIGDAFRVDMERITVLDPDLILAWAEGTPDALSARLRELGFVVMPVSTRSLADIGDAIEAIGARLGTGAEAGRAADSFRAALAQVIAGREDAIPLRVFYQVARRPLYTVNGRHYISELIRLCGGRNVFSDLDDLAPVVSVEAVLARDPEVILAAGAGPDTLERWRRWQSVAAVRADNLHVLPPDTLARPSPRLVAGAAGICAAIDASRRRLAAIDAALAPGAGPDRVR